MFVMTATPGQRWHRRCGSPTAPTEKASIRQTHLAGFSGVLEADAYAGFNELYRDGRITEAACWAHARRKIPRARSHAVSPDGVEALKRIGELYAVGGGNKRNAGGTTAC